MEWLDQHGVELLEVGAQTQQVLAYPQEVSHSVVRNAAGSALGGCMVAAGQHGVACSDTAMNSPAQKGYWYSAGAGCGSDSGGCLEEPTPASG